MVAMHSYPFFAAFTAVKRPKPLEQPVMSTLFGFALFNIFYVANPLLLTDFCVFTVNKSITYAG